MKTKKLKLTLNKTTIAVLDNKVQSTVKGGYWPTDLYHNCYTWYPQCPSHYETVCSCPYSCNICLAIDPTTPPTHDMN